MRAVAMAAEEEARAEFAAEVFGFFSQGSFIRARAEGDLLLAREGMRCRAVAHAGEFQAVQR